MSPSIGATTAAAGSAGQNPQTAQTKAKDMDKNMFLQLLVAQLRNQDPLNPSQGTEFIAQLAQFQQLEQSINTGQDISAMRGSLDQFLGQA
jgi:flagellar basal-body rod modification protein FlgD